MTVRHWFQTLSVPEPQDRRNCHQTDYTIDLPGLRSVNSTDATWASRSASAADATAISKQIARCASVVVTGCTRGFAVVYCAWRLPIFRAIQALLVRCVSPHRSILSQQFIQPIITSLGADVKRCIFGLRVLSATRRLRRTQGARYPLAVDCEVDRDVRCAWPFGPAHCRKRG